MLDIFRFGREGVEGASPIRLKLVAARSWLDRSGMNLFDKETVTGASHASTKRKMKVHLMVEQTKRMVKGLRRLSYLSPYGSFLRFCGEAGVANDSAPAMVSYDV